MKKFKFSLEKVLKQRQINADLAQKEFLQARAAYDQLQTQLQEMTELKNQALAERARIVAATLDWTAKVEQINRFTEGQDLRIKNQNLRLQEAENLVESRREILRQCVSEVKILERLEEKQRQAHSKEAAKTEQAELDELSVLRFSRNESLIKGSHEDGI